LTCNFVLLFLPALPGYGIQRICYDFDVGYLVSILICQNLGFDLNRLINKKQKRTAQDSFGKAAQERRRVPVVECGDSILMQRVKVRGLVGRRTDARKLSLHNFFVLCVGSIPHLR